MPVQQNPVHAQLYHIRHIYQNLATSRWVVVRWVARWLGRLGWLAGWLAGGWLVGWLVGWLAGWLAKVSNRFR